MACCFRRGSARWIKISSSAASRNVIFPKKYFSSETQTTGEKESEQKNVSSQDMGVKEAKPQASKGKDAAEAILFPKEREEEEEFSEVEEAEGSRRDPSKLIAEIRSILSPSTMSVEARIFELRAMLREDEDDFDIEEFLRARMERRVPPPDPTQDFSLSGAPKVKEIDENDQSLVDPYFSDKEVDKWMLLNLRKRHGIKGKKQELEWRKKYIETKALFKKMSDDLSKLRQMLDRYPAKPTKEQTEEIVKFIETNYPQSLLRNPFISEMMQGSMVELENAIPQAQRLLFRELKKTSQDKKLGLTDEQLWDSIPKYSIADATKHYLGSVFRDDATLKSALEGLRADAIDHFGPGAAKILTDDFLLGQLKEVADGKVDLMNPAAGTDIEHLASLPTATAEEKQLAEDIRELERRGAKLGEKAKPEWWDDEIQNFPKYAQSGEKTAGPFVLKPTARTKIMEQWGLSTPADSLGTHRPAADKFADLEQAKKHFRTRLTLYEAETAAELPETKQRMEEFMEMDAPEDESEATTQQALLSDIYKGMEKERANNKERQAYEPMFSPDEKQNWESIGKNDARAQEILSNPDVAAMAQKYNLDPFGIIQKKLEEAYLNYFYIVAKMELDEIEDKKVEMEKGEVGPHVHQIAEKRMVRRIKKYFLDWASAVKQDEVEERRAVFELRAKRRDEVLGQKEEKEQQQKKARRKRGYWAEDRDDDVDEYDGSEDEHEQDRLSARDLEDRADESSSEDEQPATTAQAKTVVEDDELVDPDASAPENDSDAEELKSVVYRPGKDVKEKEEEEEESDVEGERSGNLAKDLLASEDVVSEPDDTPFPPERTITDEEFAKDYDEDDLFKDDVDPVTKETKKYMNRVRAVQVLEEDTEEYKHYYDRIKKIVADVLELKEQAPMTAWEPIVDTESDLSDYDSEVDVPAGTPGHKRYIEEPEPDTDREALETGYHGTSKDQAFLRHIERRVARRKYALQRKAERKAMLERLKLDDPAKYVEEMNADFKKRQEKNQPLVMTEDDFHPPEEKLSWEQLMDKNDTPEKELNELKNEYNKAIEEYEREEKARAERDPGREEREQQRKARSKELRKKWKAESLFYDKLEEEKYARRGIPSPWTIPEPEPEESGTEDEDLWGEGDSFENRRPEFPRLRGQQLADDHDDEEAEPYVEPTEDELITKLIKPEAEDMPHLTREDEGKDEEEKKLEQELEKVAEQDELDADSLNLEWMIDVESADKQHVIKELGIQPSERICFEKAWMQVVKDQREQVLQSQNAPLTPVILEEDAKNKVVFDKMYELMYHPKEEGGEIEPMVWRDINGDPENPPLQSQVLHAYRLLAARQYRINHGLRVEMAKIREHRELPNLSLPKKLPQDTKFNRNLTEQKFTEFKTMVDEQPMLPKTRRMYMQDMRSSLVKVSRSTTKQSELPTLHLRYLKDKAIKEKKEREEKRRLALRAAQQAEAGLRA